MMMGDGHRSTAPLSRFSGTLWNRFRMPLRHVWGYVVLHRGHPLNLGIGTGDPRLHGREEEVDLLSVFTKTFRIPGCGDGSAVWHRSATHRPSAGNKWRWRSQGRSDKNVNTWERLHIGKRVSRCRVWQEDRMNGRDGRDGRPWLPWTAADETVSEQRGPGRGAWDGLSQESGRC